MTPSALDILHLFGFEQIAPDRKRPDTTRWHYSKTAANVLIDLPEDAAAHDIREALVSYGAACAREETRQQYKRFLLTFGISPSDDNLPPFLLDPEGAPLIEPAESPTSLLVRPVPF
jgi:hypothetical protein